MGIYIWKSAGEDCCVVVGGEVGGGRWEVGGGRWEVGGGRWEVGGGRWEVGGGSEQGQRGGGRRKKQNRTLFSQEVWISFCRAISVSDIPPAF
jgi:hypothetical protein